MDVHDDAAGTDRAEFIFCLGQFVPTTACTRTSIDRCKGVMVGAEALIELPFDARDAMPVHIDAAKNLGGGAAHRIVAALRRLEIDAGNAERVDGELFARRDLAGQIDELFRLRHPLARLRLVQARQHLLELARRLDGIDHLARIGVERGGRQGDRQDLAVAVGDHRPPDRQARILALRPFDQVSD